MAPVQLVLELLARNYDFFSIDDDDAVAHVATGRELRLVLAEEDLGDL